MKNGLKSLFFQPEFFFFLSLSLSFFFVFLFFRVRELDPVLELRRIYRTTTWPSRYEGIWCSEKNNGFFFIGIFVFETMHWSLELAMDR